MFTFPLHARTSCTLSSHGLDVWVTKTSLHQCCGDSVDTVLLNLQVSLEEWHHCQLVLGDWKQLSCLAALISETILLMCCFPNVLKLTWTHLDGNLLWIKSSKSLTQSNWRHWQVVLTLSDTSSVWKKSCQTNSYIKRKLHFLWIFYAAFHVKWNIFNWSLILDLCHPSFFFFNITYPSQDGISITLEFVGLVFLPQETWKFDTVQHEDISDVRHPPKRLLDLP